MGVSGPYYLVLLYYSRLEMRTQDLRVDIVSTDRPSDRGQLHLTACPYSSLCRQVVVDANGDAKQFDIGGGYASITLRGQIDINVAVVSIQRLIHRKCQTSKVDWLNGLDQYTIAILEECIMFI